MRRLVPVVLAGLLAVHLIAGTALAQDRFRDVAGTAHEEAILALTETGITAGYPDGTFRPVASVTRGQIATALTAALELPAGDASAFSDVVGTAHEAGIGALVGAGIAAGFPDGTFRPGQAVTRGQLASLLASGFDLPADDTVRFGDVRGTAHEPGINAAASAGIAAGVSGARFRPAASVTRGQMATFVARALDLVPRVSPPPEVHEPDLGVAVRLRQVATMASPIAGAAGPDGTLHVAQRAGTVHRLTGSGVGPAVVDISSRTSTSGERGLLGIAFDDDTLYLSYTDRDGDTVLAGVALDADGRVGSGGQPRTIYTLEQPYDNHNGGHVAVGPDGMVYLGLGDGGGAGDPLGAGQDLSTPLGSIIRIDPRAATPYAVPADNPFVGTAGAADEIFVYGLRNPWRFSFDRETGALWIADVGQGHREEINRVAFADAAGANFGWSRMEGTRPFAGSAPAGHVPPVYEYATRGPQGCAVTGGYVYTGSAIPALRGAYLYADYCNGEVRGLIVDDGGRVRAQRGLGVDGGRVVSFVEDADGEVYVLDLGGRVSRLEPA